MNLSHKWRRIAHRFREGGPWQVMHILSANGYLPRWLWYLSELEVLELDRESYRRLRRSTGYFCREASPDDLPQLTAVTGDPSVTEEFGGYFAEGHHCVLAEDRNGCAVGYNWTFVNRYDCAIDRDPERQLRIALEPNSLFFGVGYIRPELRLKGIFPMLVDHVVQGHSPATRLFTAVHTANEHSLRSHKRLGFRTVGKAACLRLLGSPYFWIIDFPDRVHRKLVRGVADAELASLVSC